jgi:hypothetical protein
MLERKIRIIIILLIVFILFVAVNTSFGDIFKKETENSICKQIITNPIFEGKNLEKLIREKCLTDTLNIDSKNEKEIFSILREVKNCHNRYSLEKGYLTEKLNKDEICIVCSNLATDKEISNFRSLFFEELRKDDNYKELVNILNEKNIIDTMTDKEKFFIFFLQKNLEEEKPQTEIFISNEEDLEKICYRNGKLIETVRATAVSHN